MDFLGYFMKYFYIFVSLAGFVGGGVSYFFKKKQNKASMYYFCHWIQLQEWCFSADDPGSLLNAPSQYVGSDHHLEG